MSGSGEKNKRKNWLQLVLHLLAIMPYLSPLTMPYFNFVPRVISLFLLFHMINKIHLVNARTESCATDPIGMKAL